MPPECKLLRQTALPLVFDESHEMIYAQLLVIAVWESGLHARDHHLHIQLDPYF